MADNHNKAYCPFCKKEVTTCNAIDFPGIEYNDTPIRYCDLCANMFFDSKKGEPAINYYSSSSSTPENAGWGWFYMLFLAIPGIYYLSEGGWLPGILLCASALIILLIKVTRWTNNSKNTRRSELASQKGLTSDVAYSLKRMQNPEYVSILKDLGVQIPEWFNK